MPRASKRPARPPAYLERPTIPTAYLQLLVEILGERGVVTERLFEGLPVPESLLSEARMSAIQWTRLVLRALEIAGEPGLGYEYGLRMRPTVHGLLGYAAMSATTVRAAIDIVVRYAGARQSHFDLHLEERADHCQLVLREKFPIPVARTFFYENILLGLARGSAVLLGLELADFRNCEICFDSSEPHYYRAWQSRLPPMRFDEPVCAVRFPTEYLDLRPALADPRASEQAVALCERELALGGGAAGAFSARVLDELGRSQKERRYPSLEDCADRFRISARTLKRRLHEEGATFLGLLNQKRHRDACDLLVRTDFSIHEIAARLGYENPANFSRAFARAAATSPSAYRREAAERR